MKIVTSVVVVTWLTALALTLNVGAADVPPPEVQQAAVSGLPQFLKGLPRGRESDFGFTNSEMVVSSVSPYGSPPPERPATAPSIAPSLTPAQVSMDSIPRGQPNYIPPPSPGQRSAPVFKDNEELKSAVLGQPFQLNVITPTALMAYKVGDSVDSLLTETTCWYFPILVGTTIRSILIVDRMPDGWRAVAIGSARLAPHLDSLVRCWPSSSGYHARLIVVRQASKYLFTIPEAGEDNLTPLSNAESGQLEDPSDVVSALIPAVEINMALH